MGVNTDIVRVKSLRFLTPSSLRVHLLVCKNTYFPNFIRNFIWKIVSLSRLGRSGGLGLTRSQSVVVTSLLAGELIVYFE